MADKGVSFLRIEKIKAEGTLVSRYNHDYRRVEVGNANPSLTHQNEILIPTALDENGDPTDYLYTWKKRLHIAQEYGGWSKIRQNAVLAYDIVTSYSKGFNMDLEEWKKKNVEWLERTFNQTACKDNCVLSVVFHGDESNYHCHALVIPIDPAGHLNASYYTDGSAKMRKLQDSYAKAMEEFGLKRGQRRTSLPYQDMRHMYAELENKISVPKPELNESANAYANRIEKDIKDIKGRTYKEFNDQRRKEESKLAHKKEIEKFELEKELSDIKKIASYEISKSQRKVKEQEEKYASLEDEIKKSQKIKAAVEAQINQLFGTVENAEEIKEKADKQDKIERGLDILSQKEPERAENIRNSLNEMMYISETTPELDENETEEIVVL